MTPDAAARAGRLEGEIVVDPRSRGLAKIGEAAYRSLTAIALPALFIWVIAYEWDGLAGFNADARLYLMATRAWLAGGDPWSTNLAGLYFAAPPTSLLPMLPFTLLPEPVDRFAVQLVCVLGAVASLRLLRIPPWWLLFPPLWEAIFVGSLDSILVTLVLAGAGPVAAFAKIYAVIPLLWERRWRALGVTAAALVVSAPFLPWATFLERYGEISAKLALQADPLAASAWGSPLMFVAVPAVLLAGRWGGWLAVPALWPATQLHYGVIAMPAVVRFPVAAALLALPVPSAGVYAAIAVALAESRWRSAYQPSPNSVARVAK